ncbi:MAG: gliding motility lipoprotein GldH [Bacteroidetes bacterium]|nr:gliding motility lipoprotein GldH [Bacteroidota bacterium]
MNFLKNILLITIYLLLISTLSSCDKNRVFEENKQISDQLWNIDEKLSFEVNVTDTLSNHNFYINVRNADGYPYNNLFLFITTQFPNGKFAKDTLECILADESGKWLGEGLGDIWDNQIPFKRKVLFPLQGKYIFTLEQGMRAEELPLILDAGIRIEKQGE